MESPVMRNDRSTRLDFKDKLKKRIEMARESKEVKPVAVKKTNK